MLHNLLNSWFDVVDIPSGHDMIGYYPQEDNRLTQHAVRDTEAINQSYDHYLQSGVKS